MQTCVDRFFEHELPQLISRLSDFEMRVEPLAVPEVDDHLLAVEGIVCDTLKALRELDESLGDDADMRKIAQERFRALTSAWCDQSWIVHRARSKPRGFPGDYQMLLAIYDNMPIARGLGGYLDRACLKMTLGNAVRSRLKDARDFLVREIRWRSGPVQVLDIASGPGREFQDGFGLEFPCPVHVTCLDSDAGALEYVKRHVANNSPPNLNFTFSQQNALKMRSADTIIKQFGRQDIIYSVGLADYIPDRLLIPMLCSWKDALNPDGCVYVSFKDKNYYDKVEYQWLMDWHFLQRDENDCTRLLEQAGYDIDAMISTRDETGVIINYLARAKSPAHRKVGPVTHSHHEAPANQHATATPTANRVSMT